MAANGTEAWEVAGTEEEAAASPVNKPAVAELLDHIAEELALEYVRLMETAADEELSLRGRNENEED